MNYLQRRATGIPRAIAERDEEQEIRISRASPAAGMTIAAVESENPRPRMVALKRKDKPLEMMPTPETQIEPDDLLVAIGESHSLKRLALLRSTSESLRTAGPDRMKANFIVRTAPKSAGGLARAPIVGQRCLF